MSLLTLWMMPSMRFDLSYREVPSFVGKCAMAIAGLFTAKTSLLSLELLA